MKRALVVGIDNYPTMPLQGCVNDATAVAKILEENGDGSPNFAVRLLTSDRVQVTTALVHDALDNLFKGDADIALLFFAGHGIVNETTNAGYIIMQDGSKPTWGTPLSELLDRANTAHPQIKSSVIILDSCQAGYAGEVSGLGRTDVSMVGAGVTILTACHREGTAAEADGHGLFTSLLLDGLEGGAADVCGRITPASVYSHIDQTLGPWEQRPVYKANVQTFVTLREVTPKVPLDALRRLPNYFPEPAFVFRLDPSYEEDRANLPDLAHIPVDAAHVRIFKELQMCNRHGLVVPVEAEHMYHAAINSKACRLTALGAHYRKLAELARI